MYGLGEQDASLAEFLASCFVVRTASVGVASLVVFHLGTELFQQPVRDWRLRGDLLLKSYRRRHCFYSRVLANWAASGDVTRSVSEGERSKQPRIQSVLKRQPSLTLRVTCGFAALLLWGRQSPSPSRVRRGIELDPSCTTTIGPSDSQLAAHP